MESSSSTTALSEFDDLSRATIGGNSSSSTTAPSEFDNLPRETSWGGRDYVEWKGFWYRPAFLAGALAARSNFKARDEDVILASSVKTGTTWLKAIIPCILNRNADYDPFLEKHPNELIPSLEMQVFSQGGENANLWLSGMPSPRIFRTHVPYTMLPESIKNSASKIVYITREPKDVFVSLWHFWNANTPIPIPLNEPFDSFCRGVHPFGPFHDHVLEYWQESLKRPEKILFLKYEDLKNDPFGQVQKLATFLGRPLVNEEVGKLLWKCSLERLKNLEVNQNGVDPFVKRNYKSYFRLGSVGDWKNHLSVEMKERLDQITKMKLKGSGLDL